MKFTVKIIISVTAIIAIIFSLAGIIMCQQNFSYSLDKIVSQNIENHLLKRYGVENNIVSNVTQKQEIQKEKIVEYANSLAPYLKNDKQFAIYVENQMMYSNLEIDLDKDNLAFLSSTQEVVYLLKEQEHSKYMIMGSSFEMNDNMITFISISDITDTFLERDRQFSAFYKIDAVVILVSLVAIAILSICLTKPIHQLNDMTKKIAKGSYGERIHIKSNDEIGELSESFHLMIEAVESKIEELELSVKQKEEFITNFTHEFKNPMTSIIGYADVLRSNQYAEDVKIRAANYIFNEAKRLEALSHKLMDLMGLSNENIVFENIHMVAFANKISEDVKESLGDITLILDIEEGTILADQLLLEDCIRNLIDNSKKANPKDKTITFLGRQREDIYEISIIDKGCGIPKEDLPRIKESFYMVDKARAKIKGRHGIGLSICEKIANIHGTTLIIESNVGEGTKVTMYWEGKRNER